MSNFIKTLIILSLLPVLTGCNEKQTYSYYMRNPEVLKKAVMRCQSNTQTSKEDIAQCEIVLYSATKMIALVNEQQENPEKFGQRILDAEAEYVNAKEAVRKAQANVDELKNQQTSAADLMAAQDDLYKAKKAPADQLQEIKVLLAVVGLGRPD
jgi:hypothetical protein